MKSFLRCHFDEIESSAVFVIILFGLLVVSSDSVVLGSLFYFVFLSLPTISYMQLKGRDEDIDVDTHNNHVFDSFGQKIGYSIALFIALYMWLFGILNRDLEPLFLCCVSALGSSVYWTNLYSKTMPEN